MLREDTYLSIFLKITTFFSRTSENYLKTISISSVLEYLKIVYIETINKIIK